MNKTAVLPEMNEAPALEMVQKYRTELIGLVLKIAHRINTAGGEHVVAANLTRAGRFEVQVVDRADRVVYTLRSGMELKLRQVNPAFAGNGPYSPGVFLQVEKNQCSGVAILENDSLADCLFFISTLKIVREMVDPENTNNFPEGETSGDDLVVCVACAGEGLDPQGEAECRLCEGEGRVGSDVDFRQFSDLC